MEFVRFLRSARAHFLSVRSHALTHTGAHTEPLHIVIGNQAADADSVVSALTHAYFLHRTGERGVVPIVACDRADFALRRDTHMCVHECLRMCCGGAHPDASAGATSEGAGATEAPAGSAAAAPIGEGPSKPHAALRGAEVVEVDETRAFAREIATETSAVAWMCTHLCFTDDLLQTSVGAHAGGDTGCTQSSPDATGAVPDPSSHWLSEIRDRVRVTLMDHNKMDNVLLRACVSDRVCEIVDHHKDAGDHAQTTGASRRISFDVSAGRGAGSCCTLVAKEYLAASAAGDGTILHSAIAAVLRAIVLLDTVALSPAAGKTTPEDVAVVEALERICAEAGVPLPNREDTAEKLRDARNDHKWWDTLTSRQVLRMDYKAFDTEPAGRTGPRIVYGMSSIAIHAARFLRRGPGADLDQKRGADKTPTAVAVHEATAADCAAFAAGQRLDALILLSNDQKQRQIAILRPDSSQISAEQLERVVAWLGTRLPLQAVDVGAARGWHVFLQNDQTASRKQVQPFLDEALKAAWTS